MGTPTRRFRKTKKWRVARKRYIRSEKGRASKQRRNATYYARRKFIERASREFDRLFNQLTGVTA